MIKTYLKPFSTNNKRVNVARSDKTDIWPLAGELRKIIVAKSRWRTERTTHWRWRNAKIIHATKTHWKITHHTGALFGEFRIKRSSRISNNEEEKIFSIENELEIGEESGGKVKTRA